MYNNYFITSSVDGHLGWSHILASLKIKSINMDFHVSLWYADLEFLRYIHKCGATGVYGSYIYMYF